MLSSKSPLAAAALFSVLLASTGCGHRLYAVDEQDSLSGVYERVSTAVVTLHTVGTGATLDSGGRVETQTGLGSGTVIDGSGAILTAAHVVQTAERVEVEFFDGTVGRAYVKSTDPVSDTALVQLDGELPATVKPAPLGDSDKARIGERVFVIGAPFGATHTLTAGILSARRQAPSLLGGELNIEVFQTDAAINPGNSGGPLFDMFGNLIGLVSYILTETGTSQGLGFTVTAKTCRERLLDRSPFWSGMTHIPLAGRLAALLNLPPNRTGWLVQRVTKGSLAERLGLRGGDVPAEIAGQRLLLGGDVIVEVMGEPLAGLTRSDAMLERVRGLGEDGIFRLTILRGGVRSELTHRWGDLERTAR